MATDDIAMEDFGQKGRYVIRLDGEEAQLTFTRAGDRLIIIDHTGVPPAFRGKGTGLRLVERAVADARAKGKAIIPLCPFAASKFREHPEWADVLSK